MNEPVVKKRYNRVAGLLVLIMITLVFLWPTLDNGWTNWDDHFYVINNPLVRQVSIDQIKDIFTTLEVQGIYHPLTILSFAVDYTISGLEPSTYHATNLILHVLNVSLVFWFVYPLASSTTVAAVAAILFGIHPMHLESVAWISARKDVLYGLFFLSGLVAYVHFLQQHKHRLGLYLLCLILFILSLLSKGMAVTFPLILLCIDFLLKRRDLGKVIFEKIPFLILSIGFGIIAVVAAQEGAALTELKQPAYSDTIFVGFYTITVYVLKAFIPFHLSPFHPYPTLDGGAIPWFYYGAVIPLGLLFYLVYWAGKRLREVGFGAAFFLVSILPVSQILPVGSAVIAERYTYIAYIGLFFLIGLAVNQLVYKTSAGTHRYRTVLLLLCSGFMLLMGWITYYRSAVWQNGETLWSDVINKYPDDYFAYGNRANYRLANGNQDGAMADFNQSLRLNPQFFEGYNNRGMLYLSTRDYDRARADFNRAIEINDQYFKAVLNRGVVLMTQGKYPQALADFNRTLQLAPESPKAWHARGVLYWQIKKFDAAIRDLSTAIDLTPENPVLYKDRGLIYHLSHQPGAAIEDFNRAIALAPDYGEAFFRRSVAYLGRNRHDEALRDARRAQQLNFPVNDAYLEALRR